MFVITAETANSSKKRFYIRSLSVSVLCNFTLVICSNNLLINAFLKYCKSAPCAEAGGVLKNFTIFTRKYLSQSLCFNNVASLRLATLLKKRLWHRCFPANFVRTSYLQNTSSRLLCCVWSTVSIKCSPKIYCK